MSTRHQGRWIIGGLIVVASLAVVPDATFAAPPGRGVTAAPAVFESGPAATTPNVEFVNSRRARRAAGTVDYGPNGAYLGFKYGYPSYGYYGTYYPDYGYGPGAGLGALPGLGRPGLNWSTGYGRYYSFGGTW